MPCAILLVSKARLRCTRWRGTFTHSQLIEVVRPCLKHRPALFGELRAVVGAAEVVANRMRELRLDDVRTETEPLMKHRSRRGPEPLSRDLVLREPHCPQRRVDRVVAHGPVLVPFTPEDHLRVAGQSMKFSQHRDGLMRQRDQMRRSQQLLSQLPLHARSRKLLHQGRNFKKLPETDRDKKKALER